MYKRRITKGVVKPKEENVWNEMQQRSDTDWFECWDVSRFNIRANFLIIPKKNFDFLRNYESNKTTQKSKKALFWSAGAAA